MDIARTQWWRGWVGLGLLMSLFLCWHVPLMYRVAAGQDEEFYGVPGIMVRREGIPRIPYMPSRDPNSIGYEADVALFTLPPLGFYFQGLIHLIFGEGLGQARLASTLAGLASVWLVVVLGLFWLEDRRGALLAAGVYLFCRPFQFAATTARPDMLAAAFGLGAIICGELFARKRERRWAATAGFLAGLSLLSHPFGVVPALQVGLRLLLVGGKGRVSAVLWYGGCALAGFALWLPLIWRYPTLFWIQFGTNVLGRAGPGLAKTSMMPWEILGYQGGRLWAYLMPPQALVFLLGIVFAGWAGRRPGPFRVLFYHASAALLLMILLLGRHPAVGYYVYPAALASVGVGGLAVEVARWLERRIGPGKGWGQVAATGLVSVLLLGLWLPGSGVRTLGAHLKHWDDPDYDVRKFTARIMEELPAEELMAVDGPYILSFFLAGRPVVQAFVTPFYYDVRGERFRQVLLGPDGARQVGPLMEELEPIRRIGPVDDAFACRAVLYRRRLSPAPEG